MKTQNLVLKNLSGRWTNVLLLLLVLIPSIFNAILLLPELYISVPSLNDDAVHYLLIQRASEALSNGENPFDHWTPELDIGFPQFLYYQHLPHLTVVLIHRLLLKQVDLLTLFNLIRYLLLIGLPITVYWSMRRMGFSAVSGVVGAGISALFSSNYGYGLEYGSYVWRGYGMYTQLWAIHLSFITLTCLYRLFEKGKGYLATVIACSVLILSHLIYAYMISFGAIAIFLFGVNRINIRTRLIRLIITSVLVVAITSYFWLPFLLFKEYMGVSPYEATWKYNSFGAADILTRLANGDLLDNGRFPVLTILLALGAASAFLIRNRPAKLALLLFLVWLLLFFGRHTWGRLTDLLPMHERFHLHRLIGGVHIAGIFLIGLGGEWLWQQTMAFPERWRCVVTGLVILVLMIPALRERQGYYALNKQWMERTTQALKTDQDVRTILSKLKKLPPGRAYAGRRDNWGKGIKIGDLHLYDLLTFNRIVAITPYESFSLNADLIWHFDNHKPSHYNLFNVRYVVASKNMAMPEFLRPIIETSRYTLYRAETTGYAQIAAITGLTKIDSQSSLFVKNRNWLMSAEATEGRFVKYEYLGVSKKLKDKVEVKAKTSTSMEKIGSPAQGKISGERVFPGRMDLRVECQETATLVLKMTYHPNWRVAVDGRKVQTFMVSPSFIGFEVPAGNHHVRAEYRSPIYKTLLLIFGACIIVATVWFRHLFGRLETLISSKH